MSVSKRNVLSEFVRAGSRQKRKTLMTPESTHSTIEPPSNNIDRPSCCAGLLAAHPTPLVRDASECRATPESLEGTGTENAAAAASMAAAAAASSTRSLLIIFPAGGQLAGRAADDVSAEQKSPSCKNQVSPQMSPHRLSGAQERPREGRNFGGR